MEPRRARTKRPAAFRRHNPQNTGASACDTCSPELLYYELLKCLQPFSMSCWDFASTSDPNSTHGCVHDEHCCGEQPKNKQNPQILRCIRAWVRATNYHDAGLIGTISYLSNVANEIPSTFCWTIPKLRYNSITGACCLCCMCYKRCLCSWSCWMSCSWWNGLFIYPWRAISFAHCGPKTWSLGGWKSAKLNK